MLVGAIGLEPTKAKTEGNTGAKRPANSTRQLLPTTLLYPHISLDISLTASQPTQRPARDPIGTDLVEQPAHFGVALLDQASSFDNQFDTLAENAGEIARGISVMLGGSGVSLTDGAMTGGQGGGNLCAQPADQISVVAASSDQARRFFGVGVFGFLLMGCVRSLGGG